MLGRNNAIRKDLTGKVFGKLLVLEYAGQNQRARSVYLCGCECGTTKVILGADLSRKSTISCGCVKKFAPKNLKHGKHGTKIYKCWASMINRCSNKKNQAYRFYGGRGITVCERWRKFENFYADMGDQPYPQASLERLNPKGNYEKSNCTWIPWKEQWKNRTRQRVIEFNGQKKSVSQWGRDMGFKPSLLFCRLYAGWSIQDAFLKPVDTSRHSNQRKCNSGANNPVSGDFKNGS